MAEFQWWLLIVGLVAGGGVVALVFMDGARLDRDVEQDERAAEATWISDRLAMEGHTVDRRTAEAVLWAHGEYLTLPPPDRILTDDEPSPEAERRTSAERWTQAEPWNQAERWSRAEALDVGPPPPGKPAVGSLDGDADRAPDDERDGRGGSADRDLSRAGEEQAAAREQAHAGADGEQADKR
jgi:hypothetical protein